MINRNFQAKSIAAIGNPSRIFWLTGGIAVAISILTALTGAFRPYDAIPDQDLLWLKEGLRLFSSLHATYPDHPGIYWSLSYALKIKILSTLNLISISPGQEITIKDAQTIISLSRIENGILIGLSAALIWPICRLIPISRLLSSTVVISSALSLGFLDATAQTRNEITSFLFLQLFTVICLYVQDKEPSKLVRQCTSALALTFFLLSIYCKIQILLIYPIAVYLISFKYNQSISWRHTHASLCKGLSNLTICKRAIGIFLLGGWLPWRLATGGAIFEASNRLGHMRSDIDQPSWITLNLGILACLLLCLNKKIEWGAIWRSILFYNIFITLFARVFAHKLWTSQVFSFPSNSLGFANTGETGEAIISTAVKYISDLFAGPPVLTITLMTLIISLLGLAAIIQRKKVHHARALGALLVLTSWASNATRMQGAYEIYLYPVTIIAIAWLADSFGRNNSIYTAIKMSAFALIVLATVRSAMNLAMIPSFSQMTQPREFLCFEQSHDPLLKNLSVSTCENFKATL